MQMAFIGGGTMAEAILAGVLKQGLAQPSGVAVGEPVEKRRDYLTHTYGVSAMAENGQAIKEADIVVLAVKPQDLEPALVGLCCTLAPTQTLLSIVAGARLSTLARGLSHPAVIRVMPNTPAQVSAGMSVWTAAPEVSAEARETTRGLLEAMGEQRYVADEKYLDMATALSASGPAYVWLFLESLIDAGVTVGLPREMATTLATQTLVGSARMAQETGRAPAELRHQVTSPGGTTAEALLVLEDGAFRATIIQAVLAAYERSQELGERSNSVLLGIIDLLLTLLWIAILARALLSWMPISATNPMVVLLHQVTDPILQPIRRYMPRMGGLDLSPMVALFLIFIIQQLIR